MQPNTDWRPGPVPRDTYWFGAVVLAGREAEGFHFARFHGAHVRLASGAVVQPGEVLWWCNPIGPPPGEAGGRAEG